MKNEPEICVSRKLLGLLVAGTCALAIHANAQVHSMEVTTRPQPPQPAPTPEGSEEWTEEEWEEYQT